MTTTKTFRGVLPHESCHDHLLSLEPKSGLSVTFVIKRLFLPNSAKNNPPLIHYHVYSYHMSANSLSYSFKQACCICDKYVTLMTSTGACLTLELLTFHLLSAPLPPKKISFIFGNFFALLFLETGRDFSFK